jgi:predicted RND superfamily exporter protein
MLFGSLRTGLLALVPNVLPIVFYFGLLGLLPVTLNLTTSLVAASVFGIAIDDTVVFLSRFAIESRRTPSRAHAVEATLAAVLRPTTVTMLALCIGFLALTAAELTSQRDFGLLAAATLAFAWLIDLTLTPVICRHARMQPLWQRTGHGAATDRGT